MAMMKKTTTKMATKMPQKGASLVKSKGSMGMNKGSSGGKKKSGCSCGG